MDAEKAKLREGDSARARFFRRKDELFGPDGGVKFMHSVLYKDGNPENGPTEEGNRVMESIMPLFKAVRSSIDALNANPNDESEYEVGVQRLEALKAKQEEVAPK
jgi:hypothetical protein